MTAPMAMLRSIEGVFGGPTLPGEREHSRNCDLPAPLRLGPRRKYSLCIGVLCPGAASPIGVVTTLAHARHSYDFQPTIYRG